MPQPCACPRPPPFASRRRWEQVTKMKTSSTTCHPDPELAEGEGSAFSRKLKNSPRRWLQAATLAVALIVFMGAGDDSARFKDLGHRMMCTCGCGQVLLECNHVGCQSSDKMRDQLQAAIDKGGGNSDDLILQGFVQEYGPTVIAAPTATGFNRVAWIMPFLVLALGIALAVHIVRSWKNRPEPALADGIVIPQGRELDEFRRKARRETDL